MCAFGWPMAENDIEPNRTHSLQISFELISRIQEISCLWYFSNFLGDKTLMWKKDQNMWHCCGIVASLQGQIVESERGMAS